MHKCQSLLSESLIKNHDKKNLAKVYRRRITLPASTVRFKSLKMVMVGLVGYVKLTLQSSMSPRTAFKVFPLWSYGSISEVRSSSSKTEFTAILTFVRSGVMPADWDTPNALMVMAKKTLKTSLKFVLPCETSFAPYQKARA